MPCKSLSVSNSTCVRACMRSASLIYTLAITVFFIVSLWPSHSLVLLLQILSVQQLCKICTLYWDDIYNTRSVSPHVSLCPYFLQSQPWNGKCLIDAFKTFLQVLSSMRMDSNNAQSDSFLLDDSSRWGCFTNTRFKL